MKKLLTYAHVIFLLVVLGIANAQTPAAVPTTQPPVEAKKPTAPEIPATLQSAILSTQLDMQVEDAALRADMEKVMQQHRARLIRLQILAEGPLAEASKICGEKFEPQREAEGVHCLTKPVSPQPNPNMPPNPAVPPNGKPVAQTTAGDGSPAISNVNSSTVNIGNTR